MMRYTVPVFGDDGVVYVDADTVHLLVPPWYVGDAQPRWEEVGNGDV